MWSDLTFSSYLIFALPSRPVWIDTRFEMIYPAAQYQRYAEVARAAPDWQEILDQEDINLLMLSKAGEPNLLRAAHLSGQWCEPYSDQTTAILSRLMAAGAFSCKLCRFLGPLACGNARIRTLPFFSSTF